MSASLRGSVIMLLFASLGCAGGGGLESEAVTAPGADIAGYASFGWQAGGASPGAGEAPTSVLDASVRDAIRAQLVEKGYREVEATPDLRIGFETSTVVVEKTSRSPIQIGVGTGYWGGHVGGGVGASVPVGGDGATTDQETRISIRAVDPRKNAELWVGTTTGKIDADAVEKAVARAMQEFPSRRR